MKQETKRQIVAIIALICILGSVVSTGLLYIFSDKKPNNEQLSDEQIKQIQEIINNTETSTGEINIDNEDLINIE